MKTRHCLFFVFYDSFTGFLTMRGMASVIQNTAGHSLLHAQTEAKP